MLNKKSISKKGLVQGSVLSPILFNILINDYNDTIENENKANITTTSLLYADDICIISKTAKGMNTALRKSEKHSIANKYTFNVQKCKILTKSKETFYLNGQAMDTVDEADYLGIAISIHGINNKKQTEKNIQAFNRRKFMILKNNLITNRTLNISKRINILKSFLLSTLDYGHLFAHRTKHYADMIQNEKNRMARFILGIKLYASKERIKWFTNI